MIKKCNNSSLALHISFHFLVPMAKYLFTKFFDLDFLGEGINGNRIHLPHLWQEF